MVFCHFRLFTKLNFTCTFNRQVKPLHLHLLPQFQSQLDHLHLLLKQDQLHLLLKQDQLHLLLNQNLLHLLLKQNLLHLLLKQNLLLALLNLLGKELH
jgi:hypothetical protein